MKKYIIIALALLIFIMPIQQNYLQTHAIWSKAASKTAVKAAKEIVADMAINKTVNTIANTSKHLSDSSRMVKEGHMMFCMDYTYKPGDKCNKAASVKQNLTDTDKANIKRQSQTEMEKLISPSGKGFSKWQKFLDWFVPVWIVSFAATALTYATSPEVRNLFDEAAYNTLVSLGLMAPVDSSINPIENAEPQLNEETGEYTSAGKVTSGTNVKTANLTGTGGYDSYALSNPRSLRYYSNMYSVVTFTNMSPETKITEMMTHLNGNSNSEVGIDSKGLKVMYSYNNPDTINTVVSINGDIVFNGEPPKTNYLKTPEIESIIQKQMKSIMWRAPYRVGDYMYTDVLYNTVDGDVMKTQSRYTNLANTTFNTERTNMSLKYENANFSVTHKYFHNVMPTVEVMPHFEEVAEDFNAYSESDYVDNNGNVAVLPPVAFSYEEEATGEQVERKQNPNGDGYTWQKPDGTEVPEENVIPKEEQEPKITPSPDGSPQYTPAPTPSNPAPEPAPLTPSPNGQTEPPAPEEPPLTEFPEGAKCDAKLMMPVFSPLKEQLSTSFPFSIPWDIERAAKAAFGGVGNEKPSFDMVIPVGDDKHEFKITTPAFLDDWKPFMDTFLLLSFDILLMFGLYRFVKGAGS